MAKSKKAGKLSIADMRKLINKKAGMNVAHNLNEDSPTIVKDWIPTGSRWLDSIDSREPIGVLFSGGIDSGSVLLVLYHLLLGRGESPARLKAFTLAVGDDPGDADQARRFLQQLDLGMLLEVLVMLLNLCVI